MENHVTISEFEEANSVYIKREINGNKTFKAKIIYYCNNNSETEILKVTIQKTTIESNIISFEEGDRINSINYHCEFNPNYITTKYTLTPENNLLIEGTSSKLGRYNVTLITIE